MKNCKCGHQSLLSAKFCSECGKEIHSLDTITIGSTLAQNNGSSDFKKDEEIATLNNLYNKLCKEYVSFKDTFRSTTIQSFTKENGTYVFSRRKLDNAFLHGIDQNKFYVNYYQHSGVRQEVINDLNAYIKLKELDELGILERMLTLRHLHELKTTLTEEARGSINNMELNSTKEESKSNNLKDFLDIADVALALTSPVSAVRYVIKKMKND